MKSNKGTVLITKNKALIIAILAVAIAFGIAALQGTKVYADDAVARIGDNTYPNLIAARDSLSADGQTITLLKDIDLEEGNVYKDDYETGMYDVIARHTYTIDLNGHTITSGNDSKTIKFRGTSNGNFKSIVTIKDSSSGHTGKIINTSDSGAAIKMTDGLLTLESGTLQGKNTGLLMAQDEAISWQRGKSIINGGTIIGGSSSIGWHHDDATINGGKFSDDAGNASVLPEGKKLFKDDDGYYRLHDVLAVSFTAGEGSGTMENAEAGKGAPYTLPSAKFTAPEGFGFDGWKVGANNEVRRPGEKVVLSENTTLTACWSDDIWVVRFDAGGGTGTMADDLAVKGGKCTLPENGFEGPEYRKDFVGWKVSGSNELKQPGDLVDITANTTVTAQWKSSHDFEIIVQGIMVNGDNYADVLGDLDGNRVTVSYDPKSDTLTLNDATIEAAAEVSDDYGSGYECGILVYEPSEQFSIVLKGKNTIVDKVYDKSSFEVNGIAYAGYAGKITGDGSLTIDFTMQPGDGSRAYYGIYDYTYDKGIIIDGTTVNIKTIGPEASLGMEHAYKGAEDGDLTLINGAKLIIETESPENMNYGIGSFTVSVSKDSLLEVTSKGENAQAMVDCKLDDATAALGAAVNTQAQRKGSTKWDNETDLSTYKYVRIPYAVDKSKLQVAIASANKAKENTAVSSNGKDIDPANKWTTAAEKKALDDAIAAAQAVMSNDAATQREIDEATEAVKKATDTYNKAKKAGTKSSAKPGTDPNQKGTDGTAVGPGASAASAEKAITGMKTDGDPAGSKYAPLKLKSTKQTKTSAKLTWTKVSKATSYVVYGNKCGKNNKMKKIGTYKGKTLNVKKVAGKKLKKSTHYKFIIVALDKNNNVVSTSKVIHVATKGSNKKANPTGVIVKAKVNKSGKALKKAKATSAIALKKGKSTKLTASVKKAKKTKVPNHRKVLFESSNTKIATVTAAGKVKAKKKGACYVYAYTQNGISKRIKITVK